MTIYSNHSPRRRIAAATAIESNPGLSISRQTAKKLHILYRFGRARWEARTYLGPALKRIKEEAQSQVGGEAIVIANGHSTNKLDVARVSAAMETGLKVFAVNSYLFSDLAQLMTPSHYVLSDGFHRPDATNDLSKRLWKVLDENPQIQLLAPHTWYPVLKTRRPETLYFNDCGLEGWTKNISPVRARGYLTLTAYKALALAIHFGYERVHIIGFDNSNYLNYRVDTSGRIWLGGDTHFYSVESPDQDLSEMYPQGMADCLFDHSLALLDLQRCFGHERVFNLDEKSSTHAFAKVADPRFVMQEKG